MKTQEFARSAESVGSPFTFDRNIELVALAASGVTIRIGHFLSALEAERAESCGLDEIFKLSLRPTPEALALATATEAMPALLNTPAM